MIPFEEHFRNPKTGSLSGRMRDLNTLPGRFIVRCGTCLDVFKCKNSGEEFECGDCDSSPNCKHINTGKISPGSLCKKCGFTAIQITALECGITQPILCGK